MSPYCGRNQSHTHYTVTINAKACQQPCPRPQSASLPDRVSARKTSVRTWLPHFQPGYTAVSICPECANAVLFCCIDMVAGLKTVTHNSAFRLWEPSGNANDCSNHLWLFIFICLPASCCLNEELHNGMMGYCQICMIGIFIQRVKAASNARVHLQRLSAQQHVFHGDGF